jgi:hypothetical protein
MYTRYHNLFNLLFTCWWVLELFWLLRRMLLWTWVYKLPFESLLSITLGIYLEVGLLGHIVTLCPSSLSTLVIFHFIGWWSWASFYGVYWSSVYLFRRNVYSNHLPIFEMDCTSLLLWNCRNSLCILDIGHLFTVHDLQIFSPILQVVFRLSW